MTTLTQCRQSGNLKFFNRVESDLGGPADVFVLENLQPHMAHAFLGAQFLDGNGNPVLPTAGTIAIQIQTAPNAPNWETPPEPQIDATAPTTISWAGNTTGVKAVPTGLTGVVTWRIVVIFNRT